MPNQSESPRRVTSAASMIESHVTALGTSRSGICVVASTTRSAWASASADDASIMATRLSPDDVGLQLLDNSPATAAALIGLILMFGAVSGAHFNPVVTIVDRAFGDIGSRDATQ